MYKYLHPSGQYLVENTILEENLLQPARELHLVKALAS